MSAWGEGMNFRRIAALVALGLLTAAMAQAKGKKTDVPAAFEHAQYIFVESMQGDEFRPGVYPDDRQAIYDVQDGLKDWNRYTLVMHRQQADIVLMVRRGRTVGAQVRPGIGVGPRGTQGAYPGQNPNSGPASGTGSGTGVGQQSGTAPGVDTSADVGPDDDVLRVYLQSDGKLIGPVWQRDEDGGLDAPNVPLLRQLRTAVEKAYPQPPKP